MSISKQMGQDIFFSLIYLYEICFNKKVIYYMSNKASDIDKFIDTFKDFYIKLPFFLKPGVTIWNQKSIKFDNGASLNCYTRSKTLPIYDIDIFHIDNFAHIPSNIITDFYHNMISIVLTKLDNKLTITSTFNGINLYYELMSKARLDIEHPDKNIYHYIETPYWKCPNRDEEWVKEIIELHGEDYFRANYDFSFISK